MKNVRNLNIVLLCTLGFMVLVTTVNPNSVLRLATNMNNANTEKSGEASAKKKANVIFSTEEETNIVSANADNVLLYDDVTLVDTTVFDYEVVFNNESGKVDYTFYIRNDSDVDAVLQNFEMPSPVCQGFLEDCEKYLDGLSYTLMHESGILLAPGDVIKANDKLKVVLTLEYKEKGYSIPSSSATITNLGFKLNFYEK